MQCTFRGSREEPAEYESTNPGYCFVCNQEHDLDDGEDFIVVEGAGDDVILCSDGCKLVCQDCGDDVTEENWLRHRVIRDGVVWIGEEPICFECLCAAVGGKPS